MLENFFELFEHETKYLYIIYYGLFLGMQQQCG